MLNEKSTICFKTTIKLNLIKSHAPRLKSAKKKTRDKIIPVKINELKPNQSNDLSYL